MGFAVSIRVHNITDYIQNYLKKESQLCRPKQTPAIELHTLKKNKRVLRGGNRGKSIENTRNKVAEDAYDSQMT